MRIPDLLTQRTKIADEARAILLKAETEKRSVTGEEYESWRKLQEGVDQLTQTIDAEQRQSAVETSLDKPAAAGRPLPADRRSDPKLDENFDSFLRTGDTQAGMRTALAFKRSGGTSQIELRAASPLSDVTGTAGAYTIPQGFWNQLEKAMKWFGGMRTARTKVLSTATGNTLPFPTMNDTSNVGELISENTAVTQATTEVSFGQVMFNAWKYSSKLILVPFELIQDSAFDVQAFVAEALGIRIGHITNQHYTSGDGNSKPNGVVTAATLGVTGATGQTIKVLYPDLVNLEHSVDPAYRAGAQWMFHDSTAAYLESLVDGNGRPLLNSSFAGITELVKAGEPGVPTYTIKGYGVVINNDMPTMAANAKSVLFGDFSRYVIRDVQDLMLVRFAEKYMDQGQIGFLGYLRTDGDLLDAGMHPIKYYANSAT